MKHISDRDMEKLQMMAKREAKREAKKIDSHAHGLNAAEIYVHSIKGSGYTAEDLSQEFLLAACIAFSADKTIDNRMGYVSNSIRNTAAHYRKKILAAKRGAWEPHMSGEEAALLFDGIWTGEENEQR